MKRPTNAQQALLVETLGDMAALLDRLEALTPALMQSCKATEESAAQLATRVADAGRLVDSFAESAKIRAARHIAQQTELMRRTATQTQRQDVNAALQDLVRSELTSGLRHLVKAVDDRLKRHAVPGPAWWSHAAAAVVGSWLTWIGISLW